MSAFLGFESYLVPLGASIANVHNTIKNALVAKNWQVITDTSGSTPTVLDMIPPATESIGNSDGRDVLRFQVAASTITLRPICQRLVAIPQVIALWPKTAGNVAAGVTIGGVTVTQDAGTMSAGNTAAQNLRFLYEAIRASANANFTDWSWTYQKAAVQNADDTNEYIYGVRLTAAANITITPNSYVNGATIGNYAAAGLQTVGLMPAQTLTTDLVNGFIYYLQINSRGLALATKTNTAFYGPIHACYADHTKALAALPTSGGAITIQPTPIELVVGNDNAATYSDGGAFTSHVWMLSTNTGTSVGNPDSSGNYWLHPFSAFKVRHTIQDAACGNSSYNVNAIASMSGSNLFTGANAVANDFQIHRLSMVSEALYATSHGSGGYFQIAAPILDIQDWYKFDGTATDEALLMVADTVTLTALNGTITAATTTLTVDDTSAFASAGLICIEGEVIEYTGKTSVTFTGCTRGRYGTTAAIHFDNDEVAQGLWFTKINGGALFCGTSKPS